MSLSLLRALCPRWSFLNVVLASSLFSVGPLAAQTPVTGESKFHLETNLASTRSDPVLAAWGSNSEVSQCGLCHYTPGNEFVERETDFCSLTEAKTWLEKDKHAVSRQRIEPLGKAEIDQHRRDTSNPWLGESNYVSLRICQGLGYDVKTAAGYEQFRNNCLTCHAGYQPQVPASGFTSDAQNRPGISCVYCHQEGVETDWIDSHSSATRASQWRLLPPQDKSATGMRNLVDARVQSQLCGSCHIGDHRRGMFITHEMYVAGHPPLPNFELQKFVTSMPAHWRGATETYNSLSAFVGREEYFAQNVELGNQQAPALQDTFWETRTLLIGAIIAAEQSAALTAESGEHWGDYALYDCTACHHELRIPSARQNRTGHETPGRPRLLQWPMPLAEVGLALIESSAGVSAARESLSRAINASPFGDPTTCLPAAVRLQAELRQASQRLAESPMGAQQTRRVLLELTNTPSDYLLDYHSARQAIWAMQLIDFELASKNVPLDAITRPLIHELGHSSQQTLVSTDLPIGRTGTLYDVHPENPEGSLSYLQAELQRQRQYDSQELLTKLRRLGAKLK